TLNLSGAASVNEGSAYTLNLSSSYPASDPDSDTIGSWMITWGDGSVQTVTGNPASVPHTYTDGPNTYTITATAGDDDGSYAAGNTVRVAVNAVAPSLSLSGATSVAEGSPYTLNIAATYANDPDSDTISGWTITWGDGSVQTVSGNPSSVQHT